MSDINYDEVSTLLTIVKEANGHPPLKNIHDKAYGRLVEISASLVDKKEDGPMLAGQGPGGLVQEDHEGTEEGHHDADGDDSADPRRRTQGPIGSDTAASGEGSIDATATHARRL